MQAVILVGGEGTRLRPLTAVRPKPVITLVDRPFLVHMLEWLARHGVTDVVLSCGFLPTKVQDVLGDGAQLGVRLRYVVEPEPRGTAGALKYCEELLDERFLMLNGDVLTDIDVGAQLAQHESTGARATLALAGVDDPSAYGLVLRGERGVVTAFLEKPTADQLVGVDEHLISAGIYVLERSITELIEPHVNVSIEHVIWPQLVERGVLYGYAAPDAYWLDIGTPARYLQGTFDILTGAVRTAVATGAGRSLVAPGAVVEPGASIGPLSVVGPGAVVGRGTSIERSVVLAGARIGADCRLRDCVIAEHAVVEDRATVSGLSIVGERARVGAGQELRDGAKIEPGADLHDVER